MKTISSLITWLEPHAAHFVFALVGTFLSLQIVLGGSTYQIATQHGAAAFLAAFAVAVYRAFEQSTPTA